MPQATAEARAAYQRAYRARTAAKRKQRRPNDDRARHANERARAYGALGRITCHDVARVLHRGAKCHYCGGSHLLGLDHVEPLHAGGANTPRNLVACCRSCNAKKWRGSWPPRWSRNHDACIECGTTERPHKEKGRCSKCGARHASRRRRARLRQHQREGLAKPNP